MTEKFKIINDAGDYHLMNGDEELCYDLCSPTMMQDNWNKVVDKLNKQEKTIKELNQYCTACDDTLTTIQELTYKLLTVDFKDTETKADYCHLLNELDNKDLSFIHDCIKAINKCDLMGMTQLIRECE